MENVDLPSETAARHQVTLLVDHARLAKSEKPFRVGDRNGPLELLTGQALTVRWSFDGQESLVAPQAHPDSLAGLRADITLTDDRHACRLRLEIAIDQKLTFYLNSHKRPSYRIVTIVAPKPYSRNDASW